MRCCWAGVFSIRDCIRRMDSPTETGEPISVNDRRRPTNLCSTFAKGEVHPDFDEVCKFPLFIHFIHAL